MTRVQVIASHVRRPDLAPLAAPVPFPDVATPAEGTVVATHRVAYRPSWAWRWVHGWGGAPLERWLRPGRWASTSDVWRAYPHR